MSLHLIRQALQRHADPVRAEHSQRFFKTGPGQYGEGDIFIGLTVPQTRTIARTHRTLPRPDIERLLYSKIHEERLLALFILVLQFQKGDEKEQEAVYRYYMSHTKQVNNWDLVDSSASYIAGAYLYERDKAVLYRLAHSTNLWERRIGIVATHFFIRKKSYSTTLAIAEQLLGDTHDLIHKAVGWMLREVGKKDKNVLLDFLDRHAAHMPRTTLRYALERLDRPVRVHYMGAKKRAEGHQ